MNTIESSAQPELVSLRQVAAWDLEELGAPCSIKASVPAMQRGLVWNPQQVELLWDSILRGFPIGSLVVSKKVDQQERSGKTGITHHLLDGQQRCNAITLGYADPFAPQATPVRGNKSQSILWLDLAPLGTDAYPESNLALNSTRQFLTRVTTMAHPWGFNSDDGTSRLSASQARKAIAWEYETRTPPQGKVSSLELFPWHSNAPVPLSWLHAALESTKNRDEEFWIAVQERLTVHAKYHRWPKLALDYFKQENIEHRLQEIYYGLVRSAQTQLVILEAPSEILAVSRQEQSQQSAEWGMITSIEHLFQRLNSQGTVLDGEELAYSMIKAYWPGAADAIEAVDKLRFPASHLVSLGVRAALTATGADELVRPVSLSRLRSIAVAVPPSCGAEPTADFIHRGEIERFLGVGHAAQGKAAGRLAKACGLIDRWLLFDRTSASHGLPAVLVSSFARGSSPIYLFLLHLADRVGSENPGTESEWKILLPGVASLVHWFAENDRKLEIGDLLMRAVAQEATPRNVRRAIAEALREKLIVRPQEPAEIGKFVQLPNDDTLKDWDWWHSLIGSVPETVRDEVHERWWLFLERTVWQREMLLFAQRAYLDQQFPTYDPSRKDLWENTNRPWDFDHLHADFYVRGKQGSYADFCRRWGGCIGNLRAWPFEDNRSDQKDTAKEKLGSKPDQIAASLIESEAGLEPFSLRDSPRHDLSAARSLSEAIKNRFISIYRNWYDSTGISSLIPPERREDDSPDERQT